MIIDWNNNYQYETAWGVFSFSVWGTEEISLPSPDELKSMDWAYQAQPFVDVPGKDAIDIKTMDWAYKAQPFVRNYTTAAPPTIVPTLTLLGVGF